MKIIKKMVRGFFPPGISFCFSGWGGQSHKFFLSRYSELGWWLPHLNCHRSNFLATQRLRQCYGTSFI